MNDQQETTEKQQEETVECNLFSPIQPLKVKFGNRTYFFCNYRDESKL